MELVSAIVGTLVEGSRVAGGLGSARLRLIVRRVPIFAIGWVAALTVWLVAFILMDRLPLAYAAAVLAGHALLFAGVAGACRVYPSASWVRAVVVGLCLVLGIAVVVLCVAVRAPGDVLAFMVLMLNLVAGLVFAWGWQAALVLLVGTIVPWALALFSLRILVAPVELAAAVAVGALVSLAVAEGAARSFRIAFMRRESEERFRVAFGRAPIGMAIAGIDGRLVQINDAACESLGYDRDELLGRSIDRFTHPDDFERIRAWQQAVVAGSTAPLEMRFVRKDGRIAQGVVSVSFVRDAAGRVLYALLQLHDVTEKKAAEDALRASEGRYRSLVESQRDVIMRLDLEGRVTFVNDACCRNAGIARDAILGLDVSTVVPKDERARVREALAAIQEPPHEFHGVTQGWMSTEWRWYEWEATGVKDAAGRVVELQAVARDVTERTQNEQALEASEARFRGLVESEMAMFLRFDLEGRVVYANDQICRLLGLARDEFVGKPFYTTVHEDDREQLRSLMEAHQGGVIKAHIEHRLRTPDGWRWTEWEGYALRDERGEIVEVQAVGHDIQERKEAEAALRESEKRYRGIVESQQNLVLRVDPQGVMLFANDVYCRTFGLRPEGIADVSIETLVHPDDVTTVHQALGRCGIVPYRVTFEDRGRVASGEYRWFEWEANGILDVHGVLVEIQGIGRDITDRRAAEISLQRSFAALEESREELRLLAQRQGEIREQERKRLGLDLHDDVCQEIVGVGIMVEAIRRRVGPTSTDTAGEFDRVGRYLGQLVEHLRVLAHELQPLQLPDLGLPGSLRSLSRGMSSDDCPVTASFPIAVPRLAENAEVGVYRIAQEALTNAVRHAEATIIELVLTVADGMLHLEVSDDGRGFDPDDRIHALGLVGMNERALALGGRLIIRSSVDEGTTVLLECPLDGDRSTSAA